MAGYILIASCFSAVLLLAVFVASQRAFGRAVVLWGIPVFFTLAAIFPPLAAQSFFLLVLGAALPKTTRASIRITSAVAVSAVALTVTLVPLYRELQEFEQYQHKYPIVSLAERLDYELRRVPAEDGSFLGDHIRRHGGHHTSSSPVRTAQLALADHLAPHVRSKLSSQVQRGSTLRGWMLRRLHTETTSKFALSDGFGMGRMGFLSPRHIDLPSSQPILLVDADEAESFVMIDGQSARREPLVASTAIESSGDGWLSFPVASPEFASFRDMHEAGMLEFVNPERIGYVPRKQHAAGFEPHGFRQRFVPAPGISESWHLTRLQLVSLLRFHEPRVYLSYELPQLERLTGTPTRGLDEFERTALDRLRYDEDLVITEVRGRIRMLGSLRAAKQCLDCHSVEYGELLGAFSYELRPMTSK